jgi:hypothetical protein
MNKTLGVNTGTITDEIQERPNVMSYITSYQYHGALKEVFAFPPLYRQTLSVLLYMVNKLSDAKVINERQ